MPPMQVVVGIVLMWTLAIVGQLRVYVLGSVITQWCALFYFFHSAMASHFFFFVTLFLQLFFRVFSKTLLFFLRQLIHVMSL